MSKKTEKLDLTEHVTALFEGVEGVSAEQKTKMETVLEAAVTSIVAKETEKLQESFDEKVEALVEERSADTDKAVSKYLDYVITEWMDENKLAVTSGLQLEQATQFMDGMKSLFTEHNVSIPEGKEDVVVSQEASISDLSEKLNESTAKVIELTSQLDESVRTDIVAGAADGLTDTQKEKFDGLLEGVEFVSVDVFTEKAKTIRESFFKSGSKTESLTEEKIVEHSDDPTMQRQNVLRNPYAKS